MKFCAFVVLSVFAYLQVQVYAGPIAGESPKAAPIADKKDTANTIAEDEYPEDVETNTIAPPAGHQENVDDMDTDMEFEENMSQPIEDEEATRNTSHVFNSTPENAATPSATPNLDAFMKAFEAIDPSVYSEIETFLENVVPKLPENNNPITNHLESAVFLFELYEKMKEPRDLNNSQEQHFLAEIENFLASNSFLLFNKPTAGRQEQFDDELPSDQEADDQNEQNQEYELNDAIQDNNQDEINETEKPQEKLLEKPQEKLLEKPQENAPVAA